MIELVNAIHRLTLSDYAKKQFCIIAIFVSCLSSTHAQLPLFTPLSVQAQPKADTTCIFRFKPQRELFYVPYKGNGAALERLLNVLESNIDRLREGELYIHVSSHAASGNDEVNSQRMGYLHNSRVKSELIIRAGVTEKMFVTDRPIREPYNGESNVVVVAFPTSVESIEPITAAQYEAEVVPQRADEPDTQRETTQEHERIETQQQARPTAAANAKPYSLALRANLLRWATLTPDVGVQWRVNRNWTVAVDGSWSDWSWKDKNRRYALWEVSPAIHYYIGKQVYVGAMYHIGQFNYKLGDAGKQGDLQGGGIVGGYVLPIDKRLTLDFNLGIGCTHADYDTYVLTNGVRVRTGNHSKNYWGVNKAGVTLIWKLF